MSTVYQYTISGDFQGVTPDATMLSQQIVAAGLPPPDYINTPAIVEIGFRAPLTPSQKATLDSVVAAHPLILVKAQKCSAIDDRTRQLIDAGFVFSSRTYALSGSAWATLVAFYTARLEIGLTYPVVFNTTDNIGVLSIADAASLQTFCFTGIAFVRTTNDSGTTIKNSVRAAATVAAVNAIVDSR